MKVFFELKRNLQLRLLVIFLASFSYGTVFSSITIYYNQYLGAVITGLLLAISALLSFSGGIVGGWLADRYGRKPTMIEGTSGQLLGGIVTLIFNIPGHVNPWISLIGFLLISFGASMSSTAGSAMIIDDSTPENRKAVFTLSYWAANLAIVFGAALSAWLFKSSFVILLGILVLTLSVELYVIAIPIKESFTSKKEKKDGIITAYKIVIKDKTYMYFLVASVFADFIILQFDGFLPVHLADHFQTFRLFGLEIYGQRMLTVFLVLSCVLVVLLMTPLGYLTSKWTHYKSFVVGSLMMMVGMIYAFSTRTFFPVFMAGIIYTIGEIIFTPSIQTLGADLMDKDKIGSYNGAAMIKRPTALILASVVVSISPYIKAVGVSSLLVIGEVILLVCCGIAVKRHQKQ